MNSMEIFKNRGVKKQRTFWTYSENYIVNDREKHFKIYIEKLRLGRP